MYKAVVSYDGTSFLGWQKTKEGPSIQEEIEKALFGLTQEKSMPEAASRTDRGVHAEGQVIQFQLKKDWEEETLFLGLNALLPKQVRVQSVEKKEFHPTLDAKGKEYLYKLDRALFPNPIQRLYSWHFYYPLDESLINDSAQKLIGTFDFSAFSNRKEKNPICTLHSLVFDGNAFRIKGDRFLYKMVRNLVGTLLYMGCEKIKESLGSILESKDRKRAGITAPAHGLYLHQVFY